MAATGTPICLALQHLVCGFEVGVEGFFDYWVASVEFRRGIGEARRVYGEDLARVDEFEGCLLVHTLGDLWLALFLVRFACHPPLN